MRRIFSRRARQSIALLTRCGFGRPCIACVGPRFRFERCQRGNGVRRGPDEDEREIAPNDRGHDEDQPNQRERRIEQQIAAAGRKKSTYPAGQVLESLRIGRPPNAAW